VTIDEFAADHPDLYHLAEAGSSPSIERLGLLSVTALLDLFEVGGERRDQLESHVRPKRVPLRHDRHGAVVLRDQKPLSESKLAACLVDMTPSEWIRLLNRHVFFWLERSRLERLLNAKEYRGCSHDLITFDTRSVLRNHEARAYLSPINSGSTLFKAAARGRSTFRPLALYDVLEKRPPIELLVEHGVPDAREHIVRVETRMGNTGMPGALV
jgi:hypothetical protein